MRVMVIVKASEQSETGALPDPNHLEAMGAFNNELIAAGVMLDGGGLKASASGARVSLQAGRAPMITDGPFAETKELIAGYWIWQVDSLQAAVDWAKRIPPGDGEFNAEIRPYFEPEDFAGVASPEEIAQEQAWREEQARKAPKADA
ncbi:YciI family protein [Phenylobacterium sp.]|uniref:YciI family protein n=1 Tax=Phenylobacterium sp. TaxID=1871053 RepID=UPI00120979EC|nr:YciI family protein [Phenylobacterium sp.]THD62994.1 MAG: YciI family protein [Phenylobacterium sp.]